MHPEGHERHLRKPTEPNACLKPFRISVAGRLEIHCWNAQLLQEDVVTDKRHPPLPDKSFHSPYTLDNDDDQPWRPYVIQEIALRGDWMRSGPGRRTTEATAR
jgi:hypothetical protein